VDQGERKPKKRKGSPCDELPRKRESEQNWIRAAVETGLGFASLAQAAPRLLRKFRRLSILVLTSTPRHMMT
jgi:hypothetical protein